MKKKNSQQSISDIIKGDLNNFLNKKDLFFNERDFQIRLAIHLKRTKHYDDVLTEYSIPVSCLPNYNYNENAIYIDIVVEKNNQYIPIELKYKTKEYITNNTERFGENIKNNLVIKTQGAKNIGCYEFWKDVKRMEIIKRRFSNVLTCFTIFLTNDEGYTKPAQSPKALYYRFRMSEGFRGPVFKWNGGEMPKSHPDFETDCFYFLKWNKYNYKKKKNNIDFYYLIQEVPNPHYIKEDRKLRHAYYPYHTEEEKMYERCDNIKVAMREISKLTNLEYAPDCNPRQFGIKVIADINGNNKKINDRAVIDNYIIIKGNKSAIRVYKKSEKDISEYKKSSNSGD